MSTIDDLAAPAPARDPSAPARPWARIVRIVALSAGLAVVGGLAWFLVAPKPAYVAVQGGFYSVSEFPSQYMAADGWLGAIGLLAGVIVGVVVLVRGDPSVVDLVTVSVAGVLGSALMWSIGHALGPSALHYSSRVLTGSTHHGPLTVGAKGVLLAWPIAALVVLMIGLAWQSSAADSDEFIAEAHAAAQYDDGEQTQLGELGS